MTVDSVNLRPTCVFCRQPHCDAARVLSRNTIASLRDVQSELAVVRKEFDAAFAVVLSKNLAVYAKCDPASNDATVSLAEIVAGMADELFRLRALTRELTGELT